MIVHHTYRKCLRCDYAEWYWFCREAWEKERPVELTFRGPELGQRRTLERRNFIAWRQELGKQIGAKWI